MVVEMSASKRRMPGTASPLHLEANGVLERLKGIMKYAKHKLMLIIK